MNKILAFASALALAMSLSTAAYALWRLRCRRREILEEGLCGEM